MVKLIQPQEITFHTVVAEEDLRKRLQEEILEGIGALDGNGKPRPGVRVSVRRGPKGGYAIDVSGPAPVQMFPALPPRREE